MYNDESETRVFEAIRTWVATRKAKKAEEANEDVTHGVLGVPEAFDKTKRDDQ